MCTVHTPRSLRPVHSFHSFVDSFIYSFVSGSKAHNQDNEAQKDGLTHKETQR